MSRVLVAIDLSAGSDEALRQGSAWAKRTNAKLAVMHVMPDLVRTNTLFPQETAKNALSAADLEGKVKGAVEERARSITGRSDVEIVVDMGVDYARILEHAEEWKADLLVVGAHGHTGADKVLGGVAERIARYAHCEVLIARTSPEGGCVLSGTDLSDSSMPAVAAASREATFRGVPLVVVTAVDTPTTAYLAGLGALFGGAPPIVPDAIEAARAAHAELLAEAVARVGAKAETIVADGRAHREILRLAEERHAALVVVATHGRTGLRRMALGSVAERVLRGALCSVLVVRFRD